MSQVILLVEDDANSARLTRYILEKALIKNPILVYDNAADALLYLESNDPLPLVVLLDLGLPDMHGFDVLKYIRNNQKQNICKLCVFILTVSDEQATMVQSADTGADFFLSKNINIGVFLAAVQGCGLQLEFE